MYEHSLSTQENVKEAYLHSGNTQKQIAEEFGVCERTIRYWIKYYKWYKLKHHIQHPPSSLEEGIRIQLTNLQNKILSSYHGIPTIEDVHIMQKLLSCLNKLNDTPELSELINIAPPEEEEDLEAIKNIPALQAAISAVQIPQTIDNAILLEDTLLPLPGNKAAIERQSQAA